MNIKFESTGGTTYVIDRWSINYMTHENNSENADNEDGRAVIGVYLKDKTRPIFAVVEKETGENLVDDFYLGEDGDVPF